jgi:hypothetical protein
MIALHPELASAGAWRFPKRTSVAVDLRQHRRQQLLHGNRPMAREKMAMECLPLCQTPHTMTRLMAGPRFCWNYVYLSGKGSASSGKGVRDSLCIFKGRFCRFWEGGHRQTDIPTQLILVGTRDLRSLWGAPALFY